MTEEELKQKAEAEADKVIIGSGMDRASVIHLKHLLVTMYMQGATEATKELQEENKQLKKKLVQTQDAVTMQMYTNKANKEQFEKQIEKMKCCENCKHPYWNAETEAEETKCDNCVNNSNWELAE